MSSLDDFQHCPKCGAPLQDFLEENRTRKRCTKCSHVLYGNPTPVVATIVERDGCVLLVRNKGWPEKWFGLVSGFLEAGEAPDAGALREVKEELGLDAQLVSLVGVYPFEMRNEVIIAYHARASGEVTLGDELAAYKAVPIAELKPWEFGTGLAVKAWLEARKR